MKWEWQTSGILSMVEGAGIPGYHVLSGRWAQGSRKCIVILLRLGLVFAELCFKNKIHAKHMAYKTLEIAGGTTRSGRQTTTRI
jgi:hypothetical protein